MIERWRELEVSATALPVFQWQGCTAAAGGGNGSSLGELAVVLLHGFAGDHREWSGLAPLLEKSARILAVDLPGHGRATGKEHLLRCTMERACEAFEQSLADVGVGRAVLVGYSLGGRLALYAALERGDRIGALVLESASPGLRDYGERRRRRVRDQRLAVSIEREGIEAFARRWSREPVIAAYERLLGEEERMRRLRMRLDCSPAGLAASLRGMGAGRQPWLGERLSELRMPVFLITGSLDEKFCGIARTMAGAIRGSTWEAVEGAAHNVHATHPAEVARIVERALEQARSNLHA